jgi:hypothetical protein
LYLQFMGMRNAEYAFSFLHMFMRHGVCMVRVRPYAEVFIM